MSYTDINNFLPAYPSLDERKDNLYELFPDGFYSSLFQRKEFNQLIPDLTKPRIEDGKFHPQSQQIYASRYASYNTLYDRQIIIHSMGLGKTALAVLTIESNLEQGFKGGVIAVPSSKFIQNFVVEIIKITGLKYYPNSYEDLNPVELQRAIQSNIKKKYEFITFGKFANEIHTVLNSNSKEALNIIQKKYSNKVFIVDESHNLRIQPEKKAESSRINAVFHKVFHIIDNCKIILLTATPMKDRWNEIADLANLILPLDKQLPSGNDFDNVYSNNGFQIYNEDILKTYFKGLVSTLRTTPSTVKRRFVGKLIGGLKIFNIDECRMSEHQSKYYLEAYEKDSNGAEKGIYNFSRQAINFVFPDGSYGIKGFEKYSLNSGNSTTRVLELFDKTNKSLDFPHIKDTLRNAIRGAGDSIETGLQKLSKYSMKYAKTIQTILEQAKNKSGTTFIYNSSVGGSGLLLFARILELFGYTRSVHGTEKTIGKRYAILTSETIDDGSIVANVQKTFNNPNNATGDYIQVILASKTAGEGLSFYNVEYIGVHTPFWNYSPLDQAIGRGIRYRSHEEIEKIYRERGQEFEVKIHHYASVPINQDYEKSIDYIMYKMSEDKDLQIKLGERFLKSISYDCANNRDINMKGVDFSRECEYQECEYKCEGIEDYNKPIINDTFNMFHSQHDMEQITQKIRLLYKTNFSLTLTEIFRTFENFTEDDHVLILKCLKKFIDQSIPIMNKYGFKNYLRESNDIYFLVDSMTTISKSFDYYYTSNPMVKIHNNPIEYMNKIQKLKSEDIIERMHISFKNKEYDDAFIYWNQLTLDMKELFVKIVIEVKEDEVDLTKDYDFMDWILDMNKANIFKLQNDTKIIVNIIKDSIKCYVPETKTWIECNDVIEQIERIQNDDTETVRNNPYGYYGIVNNKLLKGAHGWKHGFWIFNTGKSRQTVAASEIDKRKKIRGEKCGIGTLQVGHLASMAFKFGLDLPNQKTLPRNDMIGVLSENKAIVLDNLGIQADTLNEAFEMMSDNELSRLFRLYKGGTAEILCKEIYKWMESKNILISTDKETMRG